MTGDTSAGEQPLVCFSPDLEAAVTELPRSAHLIGEAEAIHPALLGRAPLAAPYEGPVPNPAARVGLDGAPEIRASGVPFYADALETERRLDVEQLRKNPQHLHRRGEPRCFN